MCVVKSIHLGAAGSLMEKTGFTAVSFFLAQIKLFELESFSRTKKYKMYTIIHCKVYSDQNMIRLGTFVFNYEQSII